jgi:hypothetical protein
MPSPPPRDGCGWCPAGSPRQPKPGNYRNRCAAPAFLPGFFAIRRQGLQRFAIALECARRREKALKTRPFGSPSQAGCRGFESLRPLLLCRGQAARLPSFAGLCRQEPKLSRLSAGLERGPCIPIFPGSGKWNVCWRDATQPARYGRLLEAGPPARAHVPKAR